MRLITVESVLDNQDSKTLKILFEKLESNRNFLPLKTELFSCGLDEFDIEYESWIHIENRKLTELSLSIDDPNLVNSDLLSLISSFPHLERLNLPRNQLSNDSLANINFSKVKVLNLEENHLNSIPENIINPYIIESLNCSINPIESLEINFKKYFNLRMLYLSYCDLILIPNAVNKLKNLVELDLTWNKISTFPNIESLINLRKIDLSHNNLTEFPKGIFDHHNLIDISLRANQIKLIPDAIGNLTRLMSLELENNSIISIPATISNLDSLEFLDLRNNILPKDLSKCYKERDEVEYFFVLARQWKFVKK